MDATTLNVKFKIYILFVWKTKKIKKGTLQYAFLIFVILQILKKKNIAVLID